jgi:transposase InsO family protein
MAVSLVARLANRTRHRQTGNCHRLASSGLPPVLDVEKSPTYRATDSVGGRTRADSNDLGSQPTLECAADPRRAVETWHRRVSSNRREVHRPSSPPTAVTDLGTFLRNHIGQIVAADFFVVPTATCRLLFVLVILAHERRRVVHVGVTDRPTAAWTAQQLREAFPWNDAPRYLVRDRNATFHAWATTARAMDIHEVVTAARSPWQNAYAERLIGSIRRECLDHVIVWNERGLRRVLNAYVAYYSSARTHLSLNKDAPISRGVEPPTNGNIVAIPEVGGLHHRYERRAA